MSAQGMDEPPTKKKRFFIEEEDGKFAGEVNTEKDLDNKIMMEQLTHFPAQKQRMPYSDQEPEGTHLHISQISHNDSLSDSSTARKRKQEPNDQRDDSNSFDTKLFTSFVGQEMPYGTIARIRDAAANNMEKAINLFFDGSWKALAESTTTLSSEKSPQKSPHVAITTRDTIMVDDDARKSPLMNGAMNWKPQDGVEVLMPHPPLRYIGAFGVCAWTTRSGNNLIRHGELVGIERARSHPFSKLGRGGKLALHHQQDVLTRFTNSRGEEVGRLPRETAEWVSTLIDQKICKFEGVCVYAPDRIRVNDSIYLQLRCYLRYEAFRPGLPCIMEDNRSTGLFEEKESFEERNLRLRQIALVKLFDEINLSPTTINKLTAKHKREGLLRAAEVAEQYHKNKKDRSKDSTGPDDSEEDESPQLEEDQLDTLYEKAQSFDFNTPEKEPAETFTLKLRNYQKQALYWMLAKETDMKPARQASMHPLWEEYKWPLKDVDDKVLPTVCHQDCFYVNPYSGELSLQFPAQEQHCLGGILADEMGLGKTIEMLSLIHSHLANSKNMDADVLGSVHNPSRPSGSPTSIASASYTTLVVAPTSLLAQWESEAIKASEPGSLNTLVYYSTNRINLRNLYSSGNTDTAPNLIITSYGVVLSEFRSLASQPASAAVAYGGLFSVEFCRVILDEAHLIRNRRSKSARACSDLKAAHRWVLTGTPIVNRLEDLFSLVRFLKVEPWNNFSFWKTFITTPFESKNYAQALNVVQTVLEPLVLRRTKTMKTPEGEALVPLPPRTITVEEVELSEQEREIYKYIHTRAKRTFNDNVAAGTLLKSFSTIFAQILRLRQSCCHPVLTRNKAVVAEEEDAAAAADETSDLKDDMDLQELIDHFTASTERTEQDPQQDAMMRFSAHSLRQIQSESSGECPICSEEPMIEPAITGCWHSACKKCLEDFIRHQTDNSEVPRCFSCRVPVSQRDIFEVVRHQTPPSSQDENDLYNSTPPTSSWSAPKISLRRIYPLSPSANTSAKIHALISHLARFPSGTKSVIFSQFTSFLDLISPQLARAGISHLRLDGTMHQRARAKVLAQFNKLDNFDDEILEDEDDIDDPHRKARVKPGSPTQAASETTPASPQVLLISLRAGGVGLNLTAANKVFMMDPWWSFAVEAQAIDRVHRMGQLRDVSVTRFIVKDSIEGRMLRVQERKMHLAGSLGLRVGGDGSEEERRKERIEELKLLFE